MGLMTVSCQRDFRYIVRKDYEYIDPSCSASICTVAALIRLDNQRDTSQRIIAQGGIFT